MKFFTNSVYVLVLACCGLLALNACDSGDNPNPGDDAGTNDTDGNGGGGDGDGGLATIIAATVSGQKSKTVKKT